MSRFRHLLLTIVLAAASTSMAHECHNCSIDSAIDEQLRFQEYFSSLLQLESRLPEGALEQAKALGEIPFTSLLPILQQIASERPYRIEQTEKLLSKVHGWAKGSLRLAARLAVQVPKNLATTARDLIFHPVKSFRGLMSWGGKAYYMGEGFVVRTMYGYHPAVVALIIVSQAAWEALESVVLKGYHAACHVFNGALLALVIPIDQCFTGAGYRASGVHPVRRSLAAGVGIFQRLVYWRLRKSGKLSPSEAHSMAGRTLEQEMQALAYYGLTYQERLRLALEHGAALRLIAKTWETYSSFVAKTPRLRENRVIVHRLAGRMRRMAAIYSHSLLLLATTSAPLPTGHEKPLLTFIRDFIEISGDAFLLMKSRSTDRDEWINIELRAQQLRGRLNALYRGEPRRELYAPKDCPSLFADHR